MNKLGYRSQRSDSVYDMNILYTQRVYVDAYIYLQSKHTYTTQTPTPIPTPTPVDKDQDGERWLHEHVYSDEGSSGKDQEGCGWWEPTLHGPTRPGMLSRIVSGSNKIKIMRWSVKDLLMIYQGFLIPTNGYILRISYTHTQHSLALTLTPLAHHTHTHNKDHMIAL